MDTLTATAIMCCLAFIGLAAFTITRGARDEERIVSLETEGKLLRNLLFDGIMTAEEGEAKRRLINGLLDNIKLYRHEHAVQVVLMLLARGKMSFSDLRTSGIGKRQEELFRQALANLPEVESWRQIFATYAGLNSPANDYDRWGLEKLLCLARGGISLEELVDMS